LYRRTGDGQHLDAARRSARFLMDNVWNPELRVFPFEYPEGAGEPLTYFFDSGIIIRGLLALWRINKDQALLDAAIRGGESMSRHFANGRSFHPILRLPSLEPLPYTTQWSRAPGCYQLKSAMAWHDLAVATGRTDFAELYERALREALATSATFLPAETPAKTMDRLHAFSYFLEGILPAADSDEVRAALRDGIVQVSQYLREIRPEFERSDVSAQLLRVRLLASQLADIELNAAEAAEEFHRIPRFQVQSNDARVAGGYAFGSRGGELIRHSNPVSTAFCLQALEMWSDFQNGSRLDLPSLI
jgi:hypothetical protein